MNSIAGVDKRYSAAVPALVSEKVICALTYKEEMIMKTIQSFLKTLVEMERIEHESY